MRFAISWVRTVVIVLGMHVALPGASSWAQETTTISSERRQAARDLFEQGERAYESGDFVHAGKAFDEAHRLSPHSASLWNAARSWQRARELARAANAYARYLRAAQIDAPDRDEASRALADLASKLGRVEVYAPGFDEVRVDDEAIEGTSIYVHPGLHVIEGRRGEVTVRRTELLEAGSVRSVAILEGPKEVTSPTPVIESAMKPAAGTIGSIPPRIVRATYPQSRNSTSMWQGTAAVVAGGATVIMGAFVLWSGLDTLSARKDFDVTPTEAKLAAGKDKQLRTNVLVGSTIGSAVIAGAFTSWWLWSDPTRQTSIAIMPPVIGMPLNVVWAGSF